MSAPRRLFLKICKFGEWFALFSLSLLTLAISCDVIGRYVFHTPLHGAVELGELLMIPIVYAALAHSQHLKLFVRVTLFTDKLPVSMRHFLNLFTYLLGLGIWFFVLLASLESAMLAWIYERLLLACGRNGASGSHCARLSL